MKQKPKIYLCFEITRCHFLDGSKGWTASINIADSIYPYTEHFVSRTLKEIKNKISRKYPKQNERI